MLNGDIAKIVQRYGAEQSCRLCGATISHPGVCDACGQKWERRQAAKLKAPALETIPVHFRWSRFEAPELSARCGAAACRDGQDAWQRLLEGSMWCVLLIGRTGSGKTSLACAMLHAVVSAGHVLSYSSRFDRASVLGDARSESRLGVRPFELDLAESAGVLVLDDLGRERDHTDICDVLRARYDKGAPVVVTTDLGPVDLESRYGGDIGRRLFDRCQSIVW